MDSDFSFVLVSSLQPSSSSKKKTKTGNALTERKLATKISQHETDKIFGDKSNNRNLTRISIKSINEWNKENCSNTSNLRNSDTMKRQSKSTSVEENSSPEFPNVNDLKNICLRKRKPQNRFFRSKDSRRSSNENKKNSPEEIGKNPYDISFSDDDVNNSCNRKSSKNSKRSLSKSASINSNLTKCSASSLEISDNFLKRRSVNSRSGSSFVNSFDSDPIQRPRLKGRKVIPKTPESDKSDLKNSKLNTSSSLSNNRESLDSKLSRVNSLSNCDLKKLTIVDSPSENHPRKKLRSSGSLKNQPTPIVDLVSSEDEWVIEPTIITPRTVRKKKSSVIKKIKITPPNNKKENTGISNSLRKSSNGSTNENIDTSKLKNRKFFKGNNSNINIKKASPGDTRKYRRRSSSTRLITPPLSTDKLQNINNWLWDTSKHKSDAKSGVEIIHSSVYFDDEDNKFNSWTNNKDKKDDDEMSCSSGSNVVSESVAISENLLNQLYGTEWQKHRNEVLPQSVRKKGRRKTAKEENWTTNKDKKDDDGISCSSRSSVVSESVGVSENILNQLYGTVWQKHRNEVLPQSVPKKGRRKTAKEEKKQRMSIYDVFSSSSSEDRFEQFLENVGKNKVKKRRSVKKLSTPDFIDDSSPENDTSMTFYQTHITKEIQSDIGSLIKNKLDLTSLPRKTVRQRKLSFTSSTDVEVKSIKPRKKLKEKELPKKKDGVKSKTKGSKKTAVNELENDVNFVLQDDDILKLNVDEFSNCDDIENMLNPKKKESIRKSNENILEPKTKAGRKSTEKALTKKVMGKEELPNDLKVTPKPVTKLDTGSTKKKLREINDNKIQFNPSFVVADLLSPFSAKQNSSDNSDKKGVGENFKLPMPVDIMNTPLPNPRKKRGVISSPGLTLSFLSSLSEITGNLQCHPEAKIYKQQFKKKKEELTRKLFNLYNKEIFELKLPSDMSIKWNSRMTSTSGFCYNKRSYVAKGEPLRSSRIVLSTKILDRPDRLRDTLVHELCHAATWLVNGMSDGHGPNWRAWADKATRRFPELPRITRCHDYSIQTKYTYKCMGCGYCIGRHSKSLDVKRKRCGYCYGTFEVFLTSKVPTDSAPSESDSVKVPRTPSAFAMFVKENYGTVKKENTKLPHGDVMKLLGQKFAAVKLSKM